MRAGVASAPANITRGWIQCPRIWVSSRSICQVDDDLSTYEFDELTAALQRELLQLDVDGVERVSAGPAPDGSRGVDLAALGALLVQVGKAAPVLGQVVDVIQAWAARSPKRTCVLTIGGDTLELGGSLRRTSGS